MFEDKLLTPGDGTDPLAALKAASAKILSSIPTLNAGSVIPVNPNSIDTSGRYPTQVRGIDNEDLYAQAQSGLSQALNPIMKGLSLAGTTLLNGTVGAVYGVGAAIEDGRFASFYDNDLSRSLDDWNKGLENSLPNYYSQQERDAKWYSPANLLTTNFIFDKFIKNLGYAGGAVLSGGAWAKALSTGAKLFSVGEGAVAIAETEAAIAASTSTEASLGKLLASNKSFLTKQAIYDKGHQALVAGLATTGEAGMESLQKLNEYRAKLIDNYILENGQSPTDGDLDAINKRAEEAGNMSFALNTALLTATNYVQFPKMLGTSYKGTKAIVETNGIRRLADGSVEVVSPISRAAKVFKKGKDLTTLLFSGSEAFEEGAQYSIEQGVNNYFDKKNKTGDADFFNDLVGYGVKKTLTTKEGMESLIIGGLSGGLMTSGVVGWKDGRPALLQTGQIGERKERALNTQQAAKDLNTNPFSSFLKDGVASVNRAQSLDEEMEATAATDDALGFKNAEYDYMHNYLSYRAKYGRLDLVRDDLSQYRTLASTPDGFSQLQADGIASQQDTQTAFLERLNRAERTANKIGTLYESINSRYRNLLNEDGSRAFSDEVLDKMVYAASKVDDYDVRLQQLQTSIISKGILLEPNLRGQEANPARALYTNIQKSDMLPDEKEALLQEVKDYYTLQDSRKFMLQQYEGLKNKPQEFTSPEPVITGTVVEEEIPEMTIQERRNEIEDRRNEELLKGAESTLPDYMQEEANKIVFTHKSLIPKVVAMAYEGKTLGEIRKSLLSNIPTDEGRQIIATLRNYLQIPSQEERTDFEEWRKKIDSINDKYDKELASLDEQEKLIEDKEYQQLFFKQQKDNASVTTIDPDASSGQEIASADERKKESKKKPISTLFSSTTSPNESKKKPHHLRADELKGKMELLPNRGDVYVELVTANNETHLGLGGVTASYLDGYTPANEGEQPVLVIYRTKEGYIDKNGRITKEIEEMVYEALPSTSLTDSTGQRYSQATPEEAQAYQKIWEDKRKEILSWTSQTASYEFAVSRGIPVLTTERNSVIGTLVSKKQLDNKEPLLQVVTNGSVFNPAQQRSIKMPDGALVVQNGSILEFVNNRNLTPEEVDVVYSTLLHFVKSSNSTRKPDVRAAAYLRGILNFSSPYQKVDDEVVKNPIARNQLYFHKGSFYLGNNEVAIPFTEQAMVGQEELIKGFLRNAYNHVNNKALQKNDPFLEVVGFEQDGSPKYITWNSYQHYLLSPTYDVYEKEWVGKPRPTTPVYTRVASPTLAPNFTSKYVTLNNFLQEPKLQQEVPQGASTSEIIARMMAANAAKTPAASTPTPAVETAEQPQSTSAQLFAMMAGNQQPKPNTPIVTTAPVETEGEVKGQVFSLNTFIQPSNNVAVTPFASIENIEKRRQEELSKVSSKKSISDISLPGKAVYFKNIDSNKAIRLGDTPDAKSVFEMSISGDTAVFKFSPYGEQYGMLNTKVYLDTGGESVTTPPDVPREQLRIITTELGQLKKQGEEWILVKKAKYDIVPKNQETSSRNNEAEIQAINVRYDAELAALNTPVQQTQPITSSNTNTLSLTDLKKGRDIQQPDGSTKNLRRVVTYNYSLAEMEKELEYIREKSPIAVNIIEDLIAAGNGVYAHGSYVDGLIELSRKMEQGTGYHELFHGVFDVFTSPTEKAAILSEFRSRDGEFFDRTTASFISHKEATSLQAEEALAEEFRNYVLSPKKEKSAIGKWMQKIWNYIKSLLGGDVQTINDLFSRIDAGFYKNVPFKAAPSGERMFALAPFDEADTNTITRGIVSKVFQRLFKDYNTLNELDFSSFKSSEIYDEIYKELEWYYLESLPTQMEEEGKTPEDIDNYIVPIWTGVESGWKQFVNLSGELIETFKIKQSLLNDEKETDETEYRGRSDEGYRSDEFKYDSKKNAPASIKLLYAGIQESLFILDEAGRNTGSFEALRDPSTSMELTVVGAKLFNNSLRELSSLNTLQQKEERIHRLAKEFPEYARISNRLKALQDVRSIDEWLFKIKHYATFSKQQPKPLAMYIQEDRSSYIGDVRQVSAIDIQKNAFMGRLKALPVVKYNPTIGNYTLDAKALRGKTPPSTLNAAIKYLSNIGISFDEKQVNTLDKQQVGALIKAVGAIDNQWSKKEVIANNFKSLDVSGPLSTIIEMWMDSQQLIPEVSYLNLDGDRVQEFIQTNALSRIINDIDNSRTLPSLQQELPHLFTDYASDSIYINQLMYKDGERTSTSIAPAYIAGVVDKRDGENTTSERLTKADRLLQGINLNLAGYYHALVPADAKTEWVLSMQSILSFGETASYSQRAMDILWGYYQTEVGLNEVDGKTRLFSFLPYTLTREQFDVQAAEFFDREIEQQQQELFSFGTLQETADGWRWNGLDGNFRDSNSLSETLSEEEVRHILRHRTLNFAINNTEIHKIFFGDPAAYGNSSNGTKRYKSSISPREQSLYNERRADAVFNEHYNQVAGVPLKIGDPGYTPFANSMRTVTMSDTISSLGVTHYTEINGVDAQGLATLSSYRQMMVKRGTWDSRQDMQFAFNSAQDRLLMEEDELFDYEQAYGDAAETVKKADTTLVGKGNPVSITWNPLKPIVSGFTEDGTPILDKFSIAPLTYAATRGTNLAQQYVRMLNNNISYVIAESGRKVGNKGMDSFYEADGSSRINEYNEDAIVEVPFKWYGIQVETQGDHHSQTTGSQLSKLATINLMEYGAPVGDERVASLIARDKQVREEMAKHGYEKLLKKLGITDDGGQYTVEDKKKVHKLLRDELYKREITNNIKEALQLNDDGDFTIPLEALNNYEEIKSVLYSFVTKYIAQPKVSGGSKIQQSGTGWEVAGKRIVAKTVKNKAGKESTIYVSEGLKFYEDEDGKRYMEVMLPNWFREKLPKDLTDAQVLEMLKDSDVLSGIGFRIPTQELNSIEVFRVVGFLPPEMGDTVVVPEAITTKAGSDFDVDKLNTYLKNIYFLNGEIKAVPFYGYGEEAKNKLAQIDLAQTLNKKVKPNESIEDLLEEDFDEDDTSVDSLYTQSLENEYFSIMAEILSLPQNFKRLTTPNTSEELEGISALLESISPTEFGEGSVKSVLSPTYMNNIRHQGLMAKGLVGIAAVNQTNQAVVQKSAVIIDPTKIGGLRDKNERTFVGNGVIHLPHNTTEVGGKQFSSISGIFDKSGRYISDKISQYINGSVDAFKNNFLGRMGVDRNNMSIYLLLEKLGVPNDPKNPVVSFFMNQPIIREYQKLLGQEDMSYPYNTELIEKLKDQMGIDKSLKGTIPTGKWWESLRTPIQKWYGDGNRKMLQQEQDFQTFILNEYLKYAVLSNNLFRLTQATNYDTANFSNPYNLLYKNVKRRDAESNNIFSSAEGMLSSTFIGSTASYLQRASDAISNTMLRFVNEDTLPYLSPILERIADGRISVANFQKVARKLEQTFINYLSQTASSAPNEINRLLLNSTSSLASQIAILKDRMKTDPSSSLAQNPIIKNLISEDVSQPNSLRVVKLIERAYDTYTKNVYIGAMREIKANSPAFYKDLITTLFLQSGIATSPISISDVIPTEDFAEYVLPSIQQLSNPATLKAFLDTDDFYKNNWNDPNIVPRIKRKWGEDWMTGETIIKNLFTSPAITQLTKAKGITQGYEMYKVSEMAKTFNSKYLTLTRKYPKEIEKQRKAQGLPIFETMLLRRMEYPDGTPYTQFYSTKKPEFGKYTLFAPDYALGDGYKLQEHYSSIRPSQVDNHTYKPAAYISNEEILSALQGNIIPSQTQPVTQQGNNIQEVNTVLETLDGGCKL